MCKSTTNQDTIGAITVNVMKENRDQLQQQISEKEALLESQDVSMGSPGLKKRQSLGFLRNESVSLFERLSDHQKLMVLTFFMFIFFGIHNILQEAIMKVPGFEYGVMLGYFEVLGVTICSFLERRYIAKETGRVAPIKAYPVLTFCLFASSSLSNLSLNFINFPTKVVFRSCKLIPTMLIATIINKKLFSSSEYVAALAVSFGLVMFAAADWKMSPTFHPFGLLLVSFSVFADAVLPNVQEKIFTMGASRLEVTFYTNILTLIAMTITTLLSGDFMATMKMASQDSLLFYYILLYTCVAYIAISVYMQIVKKFGGVVAVVVATARKGMTLILSFCLFPKAFSWLYVFGAISVLGGLLMSSVMKIRNKKLAKAKSEHQFEPNITIKERDTDIDLEMSKK